MADTRSDRIWTVGGIALACATAIGAAVEIRINDGTPKINGAAHFALFAQPSRPRINASTAAGVPGETASVTLPTLDYEATATIRKPEPQFQLLYVERGNGVFRGPSGPVHLAPGDRMPDGAILKSFERRNGRWTAVVARDAAAQTSR